MKLLLLTLVATTTGRINCPVDDVILERAAKALLPPAGRRLASSLSARQRKSNY